MAHHAHLQHDRSGKPLRPIAIRLRGDFLLRPGMLYGSLQPVASMEIEVLRDIDPTATGLDAAIRAVTGDLDLRIPKTAGADGIVARLADLATAVQSHFGHPICDFTRVQFLERTAGYSAYRLHLPYHDRAAVRQAAAWAIRALNVLTAGSQGDAEEKSLRGELTALGIELRKRAPESLNTLNFMHSAWQSGVPVSRVVGNILRFGLGHRARLLDSTFTDRTPVIGSKIARYKAATTHVLQQAGLPAPDHIIATSVESACDAGRRLGFPVVVKPVNQDGGRGVYAGLRDDDAVAAAAAQALQISERILVERHFHGNDFRLTVCDGEVVKVEQRIAGGVDGDGVSTVAELVAAAQASERFRKFQHNYGRMPITLDDEAQGLLEEQGLSSSSVVDTGRRVPLRRKNNVSTGGEQIAIPLGSVHPDNLALSVRAAELLLLDIAGIDLLIADISASWLQTGAAICEVNAQPQIGVRTTPTIYAELLPKLLGGSGRIPVHIIVAEQQEAVSVEALARRAVQLGCNGIANADGAWINDAKVMAVGLDAFGNIRSLLSDTHVHGAVGVMTPEEIARSGLPCERFDSIIDLTGGAMSEIGAAIAPHADRVVQDGAHA